MNKKAGIALCFWCMGALIAGYCAEPQSDTHVRIDESGTVHVPAFDVPLSSYMSEQAREAFIRSVMQLSTEPQWPDWQVLSVFEFRAGLDAKFQKFVDRARALYPVTIEKQKIGGVPTKSIIPRFGVSAANRERILLNVHGGGFFAGAGNEALIESIPVAGLGRFKVVTVDYREGPEYKFPAASEDTASVYRELLKKYKPHNIGLYGCSAGGILSAMAVAWFKKHDLPTPGAIGIFGAGAFGSFYGPPSTPGTWGGDSRFTAPPLTGAQPPPVDFQRLPAVPGYVSAYLSGADLNDPLVSPALSPAILAGFPATLLIAGTRAPEMSAAVQTQRALTNVGVSADLHLWDGMGHCFFFDVDLPESQEALRVITRFFGARLGM